jgi:signal transduction histidine kinase
MSATAGFAVVHNLNISNEKALPAEIKTCLYRILQEQLSNICKYAKAQKVSVTLIQASNKVFLKIKDDGVGFNPKEVNQGIGFSNIKKRVSYFSGRFNLTAAKGDGCSIDVELPYQQNTTAIQ